KRHHYSAHIRNTSHRTNLSCNPRDSRSNKEYSQNEKERQKRSCPFGHELGQVPILALLRGRKRGCDQEGLGQLLRSSKGGFPGSMAESTEYPEQDSGIRGSHAGAGTTGPNRPD